MTQPNLNSFAPSHSQGDINLEGRTPSIRYEGVPTANVDDTILAEWLRDDPNLPNIWTGDGDCPTLFSASTSENLSLTSGISFTSPAEATPSLSASSSSDNLTDANDTPTYTHLVNDFSITSTYSTFENAVSDGTVQREQGLISHQTSETPVTSDMTLSSAEEAVTIRRGDTSAPTMCPQMWIDPRSLAAQMNNAQPYPPPAFTPPAQGSMITTNPAEPFMWPTSRDARSARKGWTTVSKAARHGGASGAQMSSSSSSSLSSSYSSCSPPHSSTPSNASPRRQDPQLVMDITPTVATPGSIPVENQGRVLIACHHCKKRKMKCSGPVANHPEKACAKCIGRSHVCIFDDKVRRRGPARNHSQQSARIARSSRSSQSRSSASKTSTPATVPATALPSTPTYPSVPEWALTQDQIQRLLFEANWALQFGQSQ